MILHAPCKINWSLEVTGKRADDYHLLKTVLQPLDLEDRIHLEPRESGVVLTCDQEALPTDDKNLAVKAALLLLSEAKDDRGVAIHIEKRIPVAAGLAGGSSDAAAVLYGLRALYGLPVNDQELFDLALRLGADVPFCLARGAFLAQGIGEKLTRVPSARDVYLVLIKPKEAMSTQEAYRALKKESWTQGEKTRGVVRALEKGEATLLAASLHNCLETPTVEKIPQVAHIKEQLMEFGAKGALMSGSGPTVFGLFDSKELAQEALEQFTKRKLQTFLLQPIDGGFIDV